MATRSGSSIMSTDVDRGHPGDNGVHDDGATVQAPGDVPVPPEAGTFASGRGVDVVESRPGTAAWFPDVPRCWPLVRQVTRWFLQDRDNLGRVIGKRSRTSCEEGHEESASRASSDAPAPSGRPDKLCSGPEGEARPSLDQAVPTTMQQTQAGRVNRSQRSEE